MSDENDIAEQILQMVSESRKRKKRPPLGRPKTTAGTERSFLERRPPVGIRRDDAVGDILRTRTELNVFSQKLTQGFGYTVDVSPSTKLNDLAVTLCDKISNKG